MELLERKDLFKSTNKFSLIKYILAIKSSIISSFIINLINFLLSFTCMVFYILMTYDPHIFIIYKFFYLFHFSCRIIFLFDFILELIYQIIEKKFNFLNLAVDIVSIFPFLILHFVIGMKLDLKNNLDMIFTSFIIFRILKIKEFFKLFKSEDKRELFDKVATILSLSIIFSVELNIIENTQMIGKYWLFLERDCYDTYYCDGENEHIHNTFFFIMTLLTTIGYSSYIKSVLGKIIVSIVIIFQYGILIFFISTIISIFYLKSPYSRMSYKLLNNVEFIIVTGNISIGSITILAQEYFHPDHGENEKHLLVLLPRPPDSDIKQLMKLYKNKLFYFEGDCFNLNDLERVMFRKAKMIILLANKQTDNDTEEDDKTIIRAMNIKKHFMALEQKESIERKKLAKLFHLNNKEKVPDNKDNKLIMQLIKPESEYHFESNIFTNNKDQIVCINELKLGLLSKSCLCPGIITLLTNLINTNNLVEDNDKAKEIVEENGWMNDYIEGKDYEIYKISLNSKRGYYFGDIVNMVYNANNGVILFGLHIESNATQDSIVYLSPLTFKLPNDDQNISIYGYLLAKDQNEATIVMNNLKADKVEPKNLKFNNMNNLNAEDPFKNYNAYNKMNEIGDFHDEESKQDYTIDSNIQGKYLTDKIILSNSYHVSSEQILKENAVYSTLQNKLVLKRGHIIICGISQNLIDFIKPLRAKYIPKEDCPSIVILNPKLPDDKIWNSISYFDEIFLVQGNPMKRKDLLRAGILSASKVVILSSSLNELAAYKSHKKEEKKEDDDKSPKVRSLTREEEELLDSKTVIKYNFITEIKSDIFCLIELINPNNISLIKNKSRKNVDEYTFIKAGLDITLTTSFATGEVYYSNVMDNLMSQIYYNPNLLGVIKKFIMGENQKKIINNSLKKYYNIKSGNLYLIDMPPLEDIKDVYINKDKSDKDDDDDINVEISFKDIFKYLLIHKKMITIGLYKKYSPKKENISIEQTKKRKTHIRSDINNIYNSEQNLFYVVTSPSPEFKVTNKDKLFVISTIYPGKNLDLKNSDNQIQNSDQFNVDKNELDRQNNKMKNLESKQNLDREGEKKLEKINDTIDEMKILLNSTKNTLLELGFKTKQIIPESIKSTITNIYQTNNLP